MSSRTERPQESIDYPYFKDSVEDEDLHHAYLNVWQAMSRIQNPPPYSGYRERGQVSIVEFAKQREGIQLEATSFQKEDGDALWINSAASLDMNSSVAD